MIVIHSIIPFLTYYKSFFIEGLIPLFYFKVKWDTNLGGINNMVKENKDWQMKCRLTQTQKE
jgi:hypothetical protein